MRYFKMSKIISCTDTFMSGWGKCENKTNRCYVEADTWQEVILVYWYLDHVRDDQNRILIGFNKPKDTKTKLVSHVQGWLDTAKRSFETELKINRTKALEQLDHYEALVKYKFKGTFFPEMIAKEVASWNL